MRHVIFFHCIGDNLLTESDLQILKIVLVEHLPKMEKILNLDQDDPSTITKKKVIKCLQQVDQHDFADILKENQGKNNVIMKS